MLVPKSRPGALERPHATMLEQTLEGYERGNMLPWKRWPSEVGLVSGFYGTKTMK